MLINCLFCCCTHGDEPIGKHIFAQYPKGKNEHFTWTSIIANPQASFLNQRYIDTDLNRIFPGKANGNYEEKQAYKLNQIFPKYDLVIDFHQSVSDMEDMLFVKKLTPHLREYCQYFNIKHLIELEKGNMDCSGFLINQIEHGLGIEYGCKHDLENTRQRANKDVSNLLYKKIVNTQLISYRFFGEVDLKFKPVLNLKNFQQLKPPEKEILGISENGIYPVFVNAYKHLYCLLIQKINYFS